MKISFARLQFGLAAIVFAVAANAQGQQDFSKVTIKTTKITNSFYTLEGAGGVIGVLAGPDGVLMVDSEFAPLTEKIVAAIRQISAGPIRFLINTHNHVDHVGGDENLGRMGVTIVAREELRNRLARGFTNFPPSPPVGLPLITYTDRMILHMNGEAVELIAIPHAHTDGDTLVRFPVNDLIMSGDFYRSVQFPFIDLTSGGSLNGLLEGLGRLIGMAGPNTKIIPGHGPIVDRNAVMEQRDMILVARDRVAKLIEQGKTQEEVLAAKPLKDYEEHIPQGAATQDRFVGQLYSELKAAK